MSNVLINPPPENKRCERCDEHISKLKPFGKEGDPLVGNFDGALLVKTFRDEGNGTVGASWECRECIVKLDDYSKSVENES